VEQLPVANLAPDGFLERNVFLLVFHSHCDFLLVGIWDIAVRLQIQNMPRTEKKAKRVIDHREV
jgi:hypothetical protein